jgi:hypothetical protein
MTFLAYCPCCEIKVTALPVLGGDNFWLAVKNNEVVEVVRLAGNGYHRWKLNNQEKENLWNMKAQGLFP